MPRHAGNSADELTPEGRDSPSGRMGILQRRTFRVPGLATCSRTPTPRSFGFIDVGTSPEGTRVTSNQSRSCIDVARGRLLRRPVPIHQQEALRRDYLNPKASRPRNVTQQPCGRVGRSRTRRGRPQGHRREDHRDTSTQQWRRSVAPAGPTVPCLPQRAATATADRTPRLAPGTQNWITRHTEQETGSAQRND